MTVLMVLFLAGCGLWKKQDMGRATPEGLYRQGHEDYQEIRGVKYPFDDRAEVRQYLAEKGN